MVGVVNKSVVTMADEKTFRTMPTHFLLTSEVHQPEDLEHADVLLGSHPKAAAALDLLLGTQGWRRFAEQNDPKLQPPGTRTAGDHGRDAADSPTRVQTDIARRWSERKSKINNGPVLAQAQATMAAANERSDHVCEPTQSFAEAKRRLAAEAAAGPAARCRRPRPT